MDTQTLQLLPHLDIEHQLTQIMMTLSQWAEFLHVQAGK